MLVILLFFIEGNYTYICLGHISDLIFFPAKNKDDKWHGLFLRILQYLYAYTLIMNFILLLFSNLKVNKQENITREHVRVYNIIDVKLVD